MLRPLPSSTLFPYTTLFRSLVFAPLKPIDDRKGKGHAASDIVARVAPKLFSVPDRKSTRLNSSHVEISYAVFCLKKKKQRLKTPQDQWRKTNLSELCSDPRQ